MSRSQVQHIQDPIHGRCLCGKVRIKATEVTLKAGACHCQYCQKWSGGPLFTLDCGTQVELHGICFISTFNSSEWAERGFCNNCGSHLFYRLKQNSQYFIPVALFEPLKGVVFDHQIFVDQKPEWYCFSNKTSELTGDEVFALYAAKEQ